MKTLGVVITDGVGFRNFILSDFIIESKLAFDRVVLLSFLPKEVYDSFNFECTIIELEPLNEKFPQWFFRKIKEIAHLQLNKKDNIGIQNNIKINYTKQYNPRGIATRLIYKWTSLFCSENWIAIYNKLHQISFKKNTLIKEYQDILQKEKIDILFFSHQRPPVIAPLIYIAEQLKITTSTFIFSWDNLASKNRMAGEFDYYLVWSQLMKDELHKFYSKIIDSRVKIVGTPQFEPYILERYGYSKEKLIDKFSLDETKPILFFTCNDSSSKNDPLYLDILGSFIKNNKLVEDVNLIVRTSPAENPDRFQHLADKYPFIKWNHPDWTIKNFNVQEQWTQRVPSSEDISDLKSLLMHSDININVLSTITIDAFLFDKPVINPVFGNASNGLYDDQIFLTYSHLKNLVDSNSSIIVKNEKEFLNSFNDLLSKKDNKQSNRKQFVKLQIGKPLEGTSKRIAETLASLL